MRKELPIICKLIAFLAVMLVATGCSSLNNRANENIKYATMNDIQSMFDSYHTATAQKAVERDDFQLPDAFSQGLSGPGAHLLRKSKRAQIHDGAVIKNGDGSPVMEHEFVLVKSSTDATISDANHAKAGLAIVPTDENGVPLTRPNGQPMYEFVAAQAKAGGDVIKFGRDASSRIAIGEARAKQLEAATKHIEAYYAGAVKLSEQNGKTFVSIIKEGRETAIGVLQNVNPVGAAVLGAEKAVELLVSDDAGDRTVVVERPPVTN